MDFGDMKDTASDEPLSLLGKVRFGLRLFGSILSFMALIGQILYQMKIPFTSHNLFDSYLAFLVLRIVVILVLTIVFLFKNLIKHKVDPNELENSEQRRAQCC